MKQYNEAQLYLQDLNPGAGDAEHAAWSIRYRDADGDEQHEDVTPETRGAYEDASLGELANALKSVIDTDDRVFVKVFNRGGLAIGRVILERGIEFCDWRYL